MLLLLTIEAQNSTQNGLADILRQTINDLSFLTDNSRGFKDIDNYGTEFCFIAIIPSCMDDGFWETFGWKERKQIWRKKREADIRLRMNYDKFMRETFENKRLMFIDIIVKSIQIVQERSKGDFRGDELISDILRTLNVTEKQLKQLNAD